MADIKNKFKDLDPNVRARDVQDMAQNTKSIYESLAIISKRSKTLQSDLKQELLNKLEEFAVQTDAIEEVSENKEQIEISKFYERLPNSVIIAMEEFNNGDLHWHYKEKKQDQE